jgi:hypothetical protein
MNTQASIGPDRNAKRKQLQALRAREEQRRRLALRAQVVRQQTAAYAAQQRYAFPLQPPQQQQPQTFTPVQRPPSF